jgi:hypothetical protein
MASPFKRVSVQGVVKKNIEELFMDLKRDPSIPGLWAWQADVLREYQKIDSKDVGIELPTGSGKTLVGLMIGEWRRQTKNQRVAYLCPTRQLAKQVNRLSTLYGIDTRVFVGSKDEYNDADLTLYRTAKTIAILTYSGLFNTNPGINDPNIIILDDAHGAESYIGSMWSLLIDRKKQTLLYDELLKMVEFSLPPQFVKVLHNSERPKGKYRSEKVSFGAFFSSLASIHECLDRLASGEKDLRFSWQILREGLPACHMYISYNNILIRPYISPTLTHPPFAKADQRIYMSATLGRGGELERITGINSIKRIPVPETYATRGIGRRFYAFPDSTTKPLVYNPWIAQKLASAERTLVLCPSQFELDQFKDVLGMNPDLPVIYANNIEDSMDPFLTKSHATLLLANRYDGIDLPGGVCKQLIINGLPTGTNLQESFLEDRLGLDVLLRERIKTRIEQASGRCTRSNTDKAVVIMLSRKLLDFCALPENQAIMHPEIRAEIKYFLDQDNTPANIDILTTYFLRSAKEWETAEEDISALRTSFSQDTSVSKILTDNVHNEVDFEYAFWAGDYERALGFGRKVVDGLSGDRLAAYRALWSYFVVNTAYVLAKDDPKYLSIVDEFIDRAKQAGRTISWFPHSLKFLTRKSINIELSELQTAAIENISMQLNELGTVGPTFARRLDEVEQLLKATSAKEFEQGLVGLGKMLGFDSWKPDSTSEPDCVWKLNDIALLFEAKSDEDPKNGISTQDCRQSSGHLKWANEKEELTDIPNKYSILVSPKTKINIDAVPHGRDVTILSITDLMSLFYNTKIMLVESRAVMTKEDNIILREKISSLITRLGITPEHIIKLFTKTKVCDLVSF